MPAVASSAMTWSAKCNGAASKMRRGLIPLEKRLQHEAQKANDDAVLLRVVPSFLHLLDVNVAWQFRLDGGKRCVRDQIGPDEQDLRQQRLDCWVVADEPNMREIRSLYCSVRLLPRRTQPSPGGAQAPDVPLRVRERQGDGRLIQVQQHQRLPSAGSLRGQPVAPAPDCGGLHRRGTKRLGS